VRLGVDDMAVSTDHCCIWHRLAAMMDGRANSIRDAVAR